MRADLLEDCRLMANFALRSGRPVPDWALVTLVESEGPPTYSDPVLVVRKLARVHRHLSELVAPATPGSIRVTVAAGSFRSAMREIPLLAGMLLLGAGCSAMLLLAPQVEATVLFLGIAQASAAGLIGDTVLSVGAAGTGAAFYALFTMHSYVKKGTFEPKYTIVYWTRFFLGIMAGVVLVFTLEAWQLLDPSTDSGTPFPISRALTALLGGYSADAVNRVLARLVDSLGALVKGDVRTRLEETQQSQRSRLRAQGVSLALAQARDLLALRASLPVGTPALVGEHLDRLIAANLGPPGEDVLPAAVSDGEGATLDT